MSIGFSLNVGVPPALGFTASALGGTGGQGQVFQTIPVSNTRLALYALAIQPAGAQGSPVAMYTFPLSPSSVMKEYTAMANPFDLAGTPQQYGVQRQIDSYGNSPPTYLLEGTTGWQRHATDGMSLTGMQSVLVLQSILNQYAILNAQQAQSAQKPYMLEFYDYFSGDFWQVEPGGRQGIRQDANRPLLYRYSFRLMGVVNLAGAPSASGPDPIQQSLAMPPGQAQSQLGSQLSTAQQSYNKGGPVVIGGQQFA